MKKTTFGLSLATSLLAAAALTGCGGDSNDSYGPAVENQPGGHLFGFYAESMDASDPDPTVGGIYVEAPSSNGKIKGRMSFRYFDCQGYGINSFPVKGEKLTSHITGNVEGTLDSDTSINKNNNISLSFDTGYSRADNRYNGKYTIGGNDNNDKRTLKNCGLTDKTFTLARKGSLTLYPANTVFPDKFDLMQLDRGISWTNAPANATTLLLNVINVAAMSDSNSNGIVYQQVSTTGLLPTVIPKDAVENGKNYIVVVQLFDKDNNPVAFKQKTMRF